MLRPWVPLVALLLSALLLWQLGHDSLAWLGGGLLLAALLRPLFGGRALLFKGFRRRQALKKAAELDWSIIEQSQNRERVKRDCEREETLGVCTGRDCLVYESCNFNIKKPLP